MPIHTHQTKTGPRYYAILKAGGRQVSLPGGHATKAEALLPLKRAQLATADGTYRPGEGTVEAFFLSWIGSHKGLRARTRQRYLEVIRLHVGPSIGAVKMQRVQTEDVQRVVDAVERKVSVETALKTVSILRAGFAHAMRLGKIARNPASADSGIQLPSRPPMKLNPPAYADVLAVVAAAEGHPMHLPLSIAARTGLRRGEILALKWANVDLAAREIHVRQSVTYTDRHDVTIGPVKTKNALRTVPIDDGLVGVLRAAKVEQTERRLRIGQDWRDHDLVMDNGDGEIVHPERMTRYFVRLVMWLGVKMREHDLRHAYISELLSRGVSPLAVSRIAGHYSAAFTMDRYGHIMPRDFDAVRAALTGGASQRSLEGPVDSMATPEEEAEIRELISLMPAAQRAFFREYFRLPKQERPTREQELNAAGMGGWASLLGDVTKNRERESWFVAALSDVERTSPTQLEGVRILVEYQGRLLRVCKFMFWKTDFSLYLIPYASNGRYFFGARAVPEQEVEHTFDFTEQLASDARIPKLSIHDTGQVHIKTDRDLAGPLQIPELSSLRGEHVASLSVDHFDALSGFVGHPQMSSKEVDYVIRGGDKVESGRLAVYMNGEEATFDNERCPIVFTLSRQGRPKLLHIGVAPIAQVPLGAKGDRGVTVIAGWVPNTPPNEPSDFLYLRGL